MSSLSKSIWHNPKSRRPIRCPCGVTHNVPNKMYFLLVSRNDRKKPKRSTSIDFHRTKNKPKYGWDSNKTVIERIAFFAGIVGILNISIWEQQTNTKTDKNTKNQLKRNTLQIESMIQNDGILAQNADTRKKIRLACVRNGVLVCAFFFSSFFPPKTAIFARFHVLRDS